jgi:chromosome segregation ATPase
VSKAKLQARLAGAESRISRRDQRIDILTKSIHAVHRDLEACRAAHERDRDEVVYLTRTLDSTEDDLEYAISLLRYITTNSQDQLSRSPEMDQFLARFPVD